VSLFSTAGFLISVPPVPVPLQFEANVEIRIGADISASRVVHSEPILARGRCSAASWRRVNDPARSRGLIAVLTLPDSRLANHTAIFDILFAEIIAEIRATHPDWIKHPGQQALP
jgi:hypothetical protein